MIFYQISHPEDLEPGYFGIREPKTDLPVAERRGWTDGNARSRIRRSAPPGRIRRRLYDRILANIPVILPQHWHLNFR